MNKKEKQDKILQLGRDQILLRATKIYIFPILLSLDCCKCLQFFPFKTMKKKCSKNIVKKFEIAQNEQYHLFLTMFSMQSVA